MPQAHPQSSDIPNEADRRLDLTGVADRWAAAENAATAANHRLQRLQDRRGIRLITLATDLARRRVPLRSIPDRLAAALKRRPARPQQPAITPSQILEKLPMQRSSARGSGSDSAYPHLQGVHWGQPPTFGRLARHLTITPDLNWSNLEGQHVDFVMLEPPSERATAPIEALSALNQEGVPIVLFARSRDHLQLFDPATLSLVVSEEPLIVEAAHAIVGKDRTLQIDPSIDIDLFNPIGWQRRPESKTAAVFPIGARIKESDDTKTLITPLGDRATVYSDWDGKQTHGGTRPKAAKQHIAVLDSPQFHQDETAFLQRILELAAMGLPIITTGSARLEALIPAELIFTVQDPSETLHSFNELQYTDYRERHSVRLRQHVLSYHTIRHRFDQILAQIGIATPPPQRISIILSTNRPDHLEHAYDQIRAQQYPNLELVTVLHGGNIPAKQAQELADSLTFPNRILTAPASWTLGDCLNHATWHATGDLITKMDDDDFYGPHHLLDLVIARAYSKADIVGKRANFVFLAKENVTVSWGADYQETSPVHIPGATMMYTRELAHEYPFQRLSQGEDSDFFTRVRLDGGLLYSTHRYNFVRHRHGDHSFDKPDSEFLTEADGDPIPGFDYAAAEIMY